MIGVSGVDLLEVKNLCKQFPARRDFWGRVTHRVRALDGLNLRIQRGMTYALVGESGCGKTTAGRSILRLIEPSSGSVFYNGEDLGTAPPARLRELRKHLQIIFQDPYSSLNPRQTVGAIITEPMSIHRIGTRAEREERLAALLQRVGLSPEHAARYPHEFSGGQRQRICIARALALNPEFIVCDEAVSALDVSIQAQILNLLAELQQERGIAYLFISHNLSVVRHIAHTVGVMYLGQMMEEAPAEQMFANPMHPYTRALLSAVPQIDPVARRERIILGGDVPRADNPPPGCPFHPRCPSARPACANGAIPNYEPTPGHRVRCILYS